MQLLKRIHNRLNNKIYNKAYDNISKYNKRMFDIGKVDKYTYMNEIFFRDRVAYEKMLKKYSDKKELWQKYWDSQEVYSVKECFPETFKAAKKLIFDEFLSLYEDKPSLMDIGCASGEWTLMVAPFCKKVSGYEYSQNLVDAAIEEAKREDIKNVEFYQADATTMELDCQFDGGMILGMLMYMDDIGKIYNILKNVYSHLKPGAYLCTRDSLNNENADILYLLNKKSGYTGFYWSKELYYEQFYKAGFEMKKEFILEEVTSRNLNFLHIGNIWQKPM